MGEAVVFLDTPPVFDTQPDVRAEPSPFSKLASKVKNFVLKPIDIFFSGKSIGAVFVNADVGWAVRTVLVDLPTAAGSTSTKVLQYFYQAMGITTALNIAMGFAGMIKSAFNLEHAVEIGDHQGVIESAASEVVALGQAVGGAGYVLVRPLSLAALATGTTIALNSPSLLGRITWASSQLATAAFGVFYAAINFIGVFNLFHLIKFQYRYAKAEDKVAFLREQLAITDEEMHKLMNETATDVLIKEAKKMLPKVCADAGLNKKDWKVLFKEMPEYDLIQFGLEFKKLKLQQKHEAQLKRVAGSEAVEHVKKYSNIATKALDDEVIAETIEKVQNAWNSKVMINSLLTILGFFGVAATIAGFIFTGGIGAVIVTAVWILAVIIPMSIVDAYSYYCDLKESGPGKYDKHLLIASSVIAVIASVTSIVMTCVFSFGILPIVLTLLLAAIWLGINAFTYRNILEAEKKHKSEEKLEEIKLNPLTQFLKEWNEERKQPEKYEKLYSKAVK